MKRSQVLGELARTPHVQLAVIGGGATGLGVALDAAQRGVKVALLEAGDFAGGTSSRSTKLLHGGVRYLAQGDIALVREALAERRTVMQICPHLAQPLQFVLPTWRWWQKSYYFAGLKAYDMLSGRQSLGATSMLSREAAIESLPGVQSSGLCGGVAYWDGQFDDARLALSLALSAHAAGALLGNYLEVQHIESIALGSPLLPGKPRFALELQDVLSGQRYHLLADCVINATGVWVDQLRQRVFTRGIVAQAHSTAPAASTHEPMVSPSQGVHVVVDRRFLGGNRALLVPKTQDGRVLFAVPWLGALVLGTTDTPREDVVREPRPFAHELDFILSETSKVLRTPVTRADVKSVWVGLRPLVKPPKQDGKDDTKAISREHTMLVEASGVLTVTGGKWTTYRAMAEDVLQTAQQHGLLPALPPSRTATTPLFGAPVNLGEWGGSGDTRGFSQRVLSEQGATQTSPSAPHSLCDPPGLHLFGSQSQAVLACPGADNQLGLGLTEAMVRYSARMECALTVEDMLARRWRALFLDAQTAEHMAPQVAAILQEENQQDPRLEDFLQLCRQYRLAQ